jgi:hypothetical protein
VGFIDVPVSKPFQLQRAASLPAFRHAYPAALIEWHYTHRVKCFFNLLRFVAVTIREAFVTGAFKEPEFTRFPAKMPVHSGICALKQLSAAVNHA